MSTMFAWWRRRRARRELDRVSSTIGVSSLHDALSGLDRIDTSGLTTYEIASWLNNRAYVLALLGSTTEALQHLSDADELLAGSEATDPVTRYSLEVLASCVIGTRGIALLHAGSLDEAEADLQHAFDRGAPHIGSDDAAIAHVQQQLAAERLWWLALIAEKRGDASRRVELLRRASAFAATPFGAKAREALERT